MSGAGVGSGGEVVLAGEMVVRALLRRRLSLVLLVALPLCFYAARHQHVGQSIRFLTLGVAWAVSTVAFFAAAATHEVERRLRLIGWSPWALLTGRILGLVSVGAVLSGGYFLLVVVNQPTDNNAGVALILTTTTILAVLVGTFLGAVVQRELEGALLLFILAGLQFAAHPPSTLAHVLPFWSTRELGTYAIDGADAGSLGDGLLHAAVTAVVLLVLTVGLTRRHLRVRDEAPQHRAAGRRAWT